MGEGGGDEETERAECRIRVEQLIRSLRPRLLIEYVLVRSSVVVVALSNCNFECLCQAIMIPCLVEDARGHLSSLQSKVERQSPDNSALAHILGD